MAQFIILLALVVLKATDFDDRHINWDGWAGDRQVRLVCCHLEVRYLLLSPLLWRRAEATMPATFTAPVATFVATLPAMFRTRCGYMRRLIEGRRPHARSCRFVRNDGAGNGESRRGPAAHCAALSNSMANVLDLRSFGCATVLAGPYPV